MKNKLRQIVSTLITEELNEMARIATTLAIGDTVKLAKAKSLFDNDSWIGKMIKAVEAAGEVGITRDALIDATDKNQLALNPKIKDFLEIGLFIEVGLETPKKEKTGRGNPSDPTKVKDSMIKSLKGIMSLDTDEDGIIDDFEDEDVIDESFIRMQKLAGLNENLDKLFNKYRGKILDGNDNISYKTLEPTLEKDEEYKNLSYREKQSLLKKLTNILHSEYN